MVEKSLKFIAAAAVLGALGFCAWKGVGSVRKWTERNLSSWGKPAGGLNWRRDTGLQGLERVCRLVRPGETVAVPCEGPERWRMEFWRNLAAQAGWFLPERARVVMADWEEIRGNGEIDACLTMSLNRFEPLPDHWEVVYGEEGAILYRRKGGEPTAFNAAEYRRGLKEEPGRAWPGYAAYAGGVGKAALAAVLWMAGGWWTRRFAGPEVPLAGRCAVALVSGALICSLMVLGCLAAGVSHRMSLWLVSGGLLAVSAVGERILSCQLGGEPPKILDQASAPRFWNAVAFTVWLTVAAGGTLVTLSQDADCVPGLGHYGYKAKLLFEESWPTDFPGGRAWEAHVRDYPLAGALLCEWLFCWLGGPDLQTARVTQGLWLGACFALTACLCRQCGEGAGWFGLAAGALTMGTAGQLFFLKNFYQEPFYVAVVLAGGLLLWSGGRSRAALWAGAMLLAASAWVKSEGLFVWAAAFAVVFAAARGRRKTVAAAFGAGFLVWIFPWRAYLAWSGVGLTDFSLAAVPGSMSGIAAKWEEVAAALGGIAERLGPTYGWCWWLLAAGTLLVWLRRRDGRARVWSVWIGFYAGLFLLSYLASSLPLEWHTNGVHRLMCCLQWLGLPPLCDGIFSADRRQRRVAKKLA